MDPKQAEELYNARLDGEITPEQEALLEQYLSESPASAQQFAAIDELDADLRATLGAPPESIQRVQDQIRRQLQDQAEPQANAAEPEIHKLPLARILRASAAAVLVVAVGLGVRMLLTTSTDPAVSPEPALRLASGTAESRMLPTESWQTITSNAGIPANTIVRTNPGDACEIEGEDGLTIRLGEQTQVALNAQADGLSLDQGRVWSLVPAGNSFYFASEDTRVTATKGAELDLHRTANSTIVGCTLGEIELDLDSGPESLAEGQRLRVQGGNLIPEPIESELVRASRSLEETLLLTGDLAPEFEARVQGVLAELQTTGFPMSCNSVEDDIVQADPRVAAANLLARACHESHVPELIKLLDDPDPSVRTAIATGLQRITGQNVGVARETWSVGTSEDRAKGVKAWRDWWQTRTAGSWVAPPQQ